MTSINLDRERIRDLFDLRRRAGGGRYVAYLDDPYPEFQRLRETGPVHVGIVHELVGYDSPATFHGVPDPGLSDGIERGKGARRFLSRVR